MVYEDIKPSTYVSGRFFSSVKQGNLKKLPAILGERMQECFKKKGEKNVERRVFTSESVTEGHPDKMCDQISDAILDALMAQDPMSRVACETATTTGMVLVMGEINVFNGLKILI